MVVRFSDGRYRGRDLESFCGQQTKAVWGRSSTDETFESFVKRYMKDAYFIALGLVGNRDDALDLSQEAFLRAYDIRKQLASGGRQSP